MLNNRPILKQVLKIALTIALGALGGGAVLTVKPTDPPAPAPVQGVLAVAPDAPKPPAQMTTPDGTVEAGWKPNPAAVQRVLQMHPKGGTIRQVAPHLFPKQGDNAQSKKDALLYKYVAQVNGGKNPPAHNQQQVGCCVSEGTSTAVECLECVEIVKKHDPETFKTISHSAVYGLARARGHMLGRKDGLVGAYAAQSVKLDGVVSCEDAGETNQTSGFAKNWGLSGVPANIKELAAKRKVGDFAQVQTADDAYTALSNGYPIAVCSNVGFTMTRDSRGACRPEGTWNHCMACLGYRSDTDQYLIVQSWGDNVPSGPTQLEQPTYSFWIDAKVLDHMVGQGDSFAFSNFDGWPAQELDWFARRNDAIRGYQEAVARLSLPPRR